MNEAAPSEFAHRGIVEGYYGPPWADEDRRWWIDRLADWGMNRFVIAPKDDPLGRERWRDPYPAERLAAFAEWIAHGERRDLAVGFGLSPGLSIVHADADDQRALARKARDFAERGARFLALCFDDVPFALEHAPDRAAFRSVAAAQVSTAHALRDALGDEITLWFVPTDYGGNAGSEYLEELGVALAAGIEVAWTGPAVLSGTIPVEDAARRAALLRRKLLLWDNVPVADGPMRTMLHLGPWSGRSPELAEHCSGALLNPMQHARSSALTVGTAFQHDPEAAWRSVACSLGAGAEDAFLCFARAHRTSPMAPDDRDEVLECAFHALESDPGPDALEPLRALVDARVAVRDALERGLSDRRLYAEIRPWVESHHAESQRMAIVLEALAAVWQGGPALDRCLAWVRAEGRLTRTPPAPFASYGPRRVFYPQLATQDPERAHFGGGPMLLRDRCLADEVIAFCESQVLGVLAEAPSG